MNIKDFLIPFSFALLVTAGLNYFFGWGSQKSGPVQAPRSQELARPLNTTVEWGPEKGQGEEVSEIETSYGHLEFSSFGASLRSMIYYRKVNGNSLHLTTLTPPAEFEKDRSCFLVALQEDTPYFYELVERTEDACTTRLTYRAKNNDGTIEKLFVIDKIHYKIDLILTLKPYTQRQMQPRVFFPAPKLAGADKAEHNAALVEEKDKSLAKYRESRHLRTLQDNYWFALSSLGLEDRYFAHVLYNDANGFIQRGYFKVDTGLLIAIAEGPTVSQDTTWKISFYFGPKEHEALVTVDPRLEELLDYGWLAPLSKPMLAFMKWLNGYVHNFGLVIILLTLLMRLLLLPLTLRSTKSAEKAREMQKKLQYLKQKYKNDPEGYEREQQELYQKYGLAGLGGVLGGGCLPILLQMPVFFAMNRVLSSSIELYQAPFLWIPDLSAHDPYYILSLLVGVSMLLTTITVSDAQQRISGIVMALIFGAFSVGFSAGLSLYICASTVAAVAQTVIQKALKLA